MAAARMTAAPKAAGSGDHTRSNSIKNLGNGVKPKTKSIINDR